MFPLVIFSAGLLAASTPPSADSELKTYQSLNASVGRNPAEHVKLALWCEAHGLNAERLRHLSTAVLIDPANVKARDV